MTPPQIRLAVETDAAQIHAIYAPVVRDTAISFEIAPPTVEEMAQRIHKTLERFPWLVCCRGDDLLGYAYASPYRARLSYQWSVETTVYVSSHARKMGVGTALYRSLFAILKLQGIVSVYAGIALPNPASIGLHEALGFQPVGVFRRAGYKLGAWRDVGFWQLTLNEPPDQPAAPLSLPEIRSSEAFQPALENGIPFIHAR